MKRINSIFVVVLCVILLVINSCSKQRKIWLCTQPWNIACTSYYDSLWSINVSSMIISQNPISAGMPITIQLNYPEKGELDYEVFAVQGTKVDSGQLQFIAVAQQSSATYTIPSTLIPGSYILVLKHNGIAIISKKFMVV